MRTLPRLVIEPIVRAALLEDLGRAGDLTTDSTIPPDAPRPSSWSAATRASSPGWGWPNWPGNSSIPPSAPRSTWLTAHGSNRAV